MPHPQLRTVVVSVAAPLWASAEAAQRFPTFDPSSYGAYREWMRALAGGPSMNGSLDSVALCGEPVHVIDQSGAFARVELPFQPNGRSGYTGYVRADHVGEDRREAATHVVAERDVRGTVASPAADVELPPGTTVQVLERTGRDRARVVMPAGTTVEVSERALQPVGSLLSARAIYRIATGYQGVPYVWGGTDAAGIDCSGLIHVAARLGGVVVPRDAHHQWAATRIEADWEDLEVGDLLFFGADASLEGIDHVGLYAGRGRMLHAPEEGRTVTLEPISARARNRAVAFGRYPTNDDDAMKENDTTDVQIGIK